GKTPNPVGLNGRHPRRHLQPASAPAAPMPPPAPRRSSFPVAAALLAAALLILAAGAVAVADDGRTLLEIKKSFRDADNALRDWSGDGASPGYCSWLGVLCDNVTFQVAALNLSGFNLGGEISPAIGDLKSVVSIDFQSSGLSGQIPDEIGDCWSLKMLEPVLQQSGRRHTLFHI
uniref:Leucine-rich repeat-containing N-terminal plant-type domain-containing protein n=1 Tax=Aegilops tauschii subsp. strangulata TaxID=200361 RepID=A0A453PRU5_AEGTS